jgi:hypothetical protein
MAFPKPENLEPQGCHLSPPEATADEKREQSTIAPAAEGVSIFRAQQLLALLSSQQFPTRTPSRPASVSALKNHGRSLGRIDGWWSDSLPEW